MIEQILAVTVGMADTVMVANNGEAAVSGISLVDTINIPVSYTHLPFSGKSACSTPICPTS